MKLMGGRSAQNHRKDVMCIVFWRIYMIADAIVWAGILFGAALVLEGSGYFGKMMLILAGGAFFFLVLLPGAWNSPDRWSGN